MKNYGCMNLNDEKLLLQIKEKDELAFHCFYKKYSPLIIERLYKIVNNRENVFDIAQNIWVEIWDCPDKIKTNEKGCAIGFLVVFCTYKGYQFYREKQKKSVPMLLPALEDSVNEDLVSDDVFGNLNVNDLNQQIDCFLDKQPAMSKEIFNLCKRQGYSIPEVAKILSSTNASVSVRLSNTLKQLKAHLICLHENNFIELVFVTLYLFQDIV